MKAHLMFALLAAAVVCCASPAAAQLDASCVASITLNFDPGPLAARQDLAQSRPGISSSRYSCGTSSSGN
jgi:hypothetical protein